LRPSRRTSFACGSRPVALWDATFAMPYRVFRSRVREMIQVMN